MRPRFSFFPDDSANVFEHADSVQIKLIQIRDELAIEFNVSGGFFPDDDEESDITSRQPDAAQFARLLLAGFVAAKAKGGAQ